MVSKVLLALCAMLAVATAVPAGVWPPVGAGWPQISAGWPQFSAGWPQIGVVWPQAGGPNPWISSWASPAPWAPQWAACTTIGSDCLDCTTKVVCTKIGGIEKACSDPTLPYCNAGECSATPSATCAAVPAVPAAPAA